MRKAAVVVGVLGFGLLAGCMGKQMPDGNGTILGTVNDQAVLNVGNKTLIGQVTTLIGRRSTGPSSYRQTQQLQVSDGYLTCSTPLNEKWGGGTEGVFVGKSYNTELSCSDGTTGRMQVTVNSENGLCCTGLGTGRLSNGTRLRLTFGPSVNVTNTNF